MDSGAIGQEGGRFTVLPVARRKQQTRRDAFFGQENIAEIGCPFELVDVPGCGQYRVTGLAGRPPGSDVDTSAEAVE